MFDILFQGANVVDGAHPPRRADVAVEGGRIAAVGRGLGPARRSIDVAGRTLVPGFIDIHTHSDFTLPVRPAAAAKLLQGVTTDVTGNCGFSPFPLHAQDGGARHGSFIEPELDERWPSLAEYTEDMDSRGLGINLAPLVGLGAVRLAVVGEDDVRADGRAVEEMSALVRRALREGAFGASSGLVYAPSSFADIDELVALGRVVAEEGGIYATHMRNEGEQLDEALKEALEVGRRSACPVQISHLKLLGRRSWGRIQAVFERIEDARASGQDVWADAYPYTAGSSTLASLLPASELHGGIEALQKALADPAQRTRLVRTIEDGGAFAVEDVWFATVPSQPELDGLRLVDAAAERGVAPAELVLQLLETGGTSTSMVGFGMNEEDVRQVLSAPYVMAGSDGWTMAADATAYSHPRNFAYSVRLLGHYVRDEGLLALPEAVAKLSTLPALRLGLTNRGVVEPDAVADLAVFDLDLLSEESSFKEPNAYPLGIEYVCVNGRLAVENGELTGERAGVVLRAARGAR